MNVLAIGAHPDDIEFGCAGTLAKHQKNGDNVQMVIMSSSTVQDAHTREILRDATTSVNEANSAAAVLGITPIIAPFQDTKVPFDGESVAFLEKIVKHWEIDLIYTHWPGDTHQDHIATLNTSLAAGRLVNNVYSYEQVPLPRVTVSYHKVNHFVDITDFMELKLEACSKHISQVTKFKNRQNVDILKALEAQARFRGAQIGKEYAEGFHVLKTVV